MLKVVAVLVAVCSVVVASDLCQANEDWFTAGTVGFTDFATAGVTPNSKYFCWNPCMSTRVLSQKMKVKLARNHTQSFPTRFVNRKSRAVTRNTGNVENCEDRTLREDIKNTLTTVTNNSASAIARTLLYQIGRPGWVYNVVERKSGFQADSEIFDKNYCLYIYETDDLMYNIHVVAIDMS